MQFITALERLCYEKYVLELAIATLERGGVTAKIDTCQLLEPIDAWGLPRYPDRTVVLPPETYLPHAIMTFIEKNEPCLMEADNWLGTWIDPHTGICYLDITTIYPCLEDAQREASLRNQESQRKIIALYNFQREQTLFL